MTFIISLASAINICYQHARAATEPVLLQSNIVKFSEVY